MRRNAGCSDTFRPLKGKKDSLSGLPFLVGAIIYEVIATMSLRASENLSKFGFVAIVIVGYVGAFLLLNYALVKGVPLGVAYGIWVASGVALVAVLSVPIFGETLTLIQIGG